MKMLRYLLMSALVLAIAVPLMAAQEKAKRGEKRQSREKQQRAQIIPNELLKGLELSAEQKAKIEALGEQVKPKFEEARKAVEAILSDEQKAARAEAQKAAKAAGKSGREAREAVQAALKLTEEQKVKLEQAEKVMGELRKQIRDKMMAVLTPEQQEAVKAKMKQGHGREGKAREGKKQK